MKRIDVIFNELVMDYSGFGISTMDIAEATGFTRANVSSDLNKLVEMNKARKVNGKPVLYHPIIKLSKLEQFARENSSLQMIISQAQAAVLYPPKGLNMLIYGETGVGKSMLAMLIYEYAKHTKQNQSDLPFVQFNCADYANNPQLLVGQLFGIAKNAFTGANEDTMGLIEKANGGILFLDEIHRLPPEGQEILFTFLDRESFHRLGESHVERTASVQIIAATTEAPESALLQTFQRRIPMILKMPNLNERSAEERINLIYLFFQHEANRLNETIKVTKNTIRAFLSYDCPNNIGQLKNDIQLSSAKAYADFIVKGQKEISIHSPELPQYILTGLYSETAGRDKWVKLNQQAGNYVVFSPEQQDGKEAINFKRNLSDLINEAAPTDTDDALPYENIQAILEANFESIYPTRYNNKSEMENLKALITEPLYNICIDTINLAEELLHRSINSKLKHSMAIHIFTTYNRIKRGDLLKKHFDNSSIIESYPEYVEVAKECLLYLNAALDIDIPDEEIPFLAMFFIYNEETEIKATENVQIIVVTHGPSTATSMVTFVNSLLNTQHAWGINMNLDENPQTVLQRLKHLLIDSQVKSDILFLVDMGSLANIGIEIEKELHLHCKTITLASTTHVLEATRKAIMGASLEEIYQDTLQISYFNQVTTADASPFTMLPDEDKPSVILSFCITGEGTAITMKNILEQKLSDLPETVKILPVTILQDESITHYIRLMQNQYHILCIVSSIPVETALPQFQLLDLFNPQAIEQIQTLIDTDATYRDIELTLKSELTHSDSHEVVRDAKTFIRTVENILGMHFDIKIVFGAIFHISCLIDRLHGDYNIADFPDKDNYRECHQKEYRLVCELIQPIEDKYEVEIPENELLYIVSLLFSNAYEKK